MRPLPRILGKIKATKEREVEVLLLTPYSELLYSAECSLENDPPRDFLTAVSSPVGGTPNLIAEVKKASPSKGIIREDFDPPSIAKAYQAGGAAAISCLTDRDYFQGSLEFLIAVRKAVSLPVLRKDFIISPAQICEARTAGADAVLLIARMLTKDEIGEIHQLTRELGMTALIEVHDKPDIDKVLPLSPELIGINSRDLDTFEVDCERAFKLRESIPDAIPTVGESGIFTSQDMHQLTQNGMVAALVGESLMRCHDVEEAVKRLLS